jgi:hypothetical protein
MTRTEAISNFLKHSTHEDLWKLYTKNMEVQVNVAKDDGKLVESGDFRGRASRTWTDGVTNWYPFRIPLHANTDTPTLNDSLMLFSLEQHAEGIGMTGWDFTNKVSKWVCFDFDAITGHSTRHAKKLTEQQLTEVRDAINKLPWTTLRLSTSGRGLHLYVFLNDVPTSTHTEHAALARAILGMMCGMTGFDFANTVDVCGGNMWVWHRKMKGTDGLKLIKEGTILTDVPTNWRDHVSVISRKQKKALPQFVKDLNVNDPSSLFEELSGQRAKIPLDVEHKKLIEFLGNQGGAWWWDNDNWMLVCHTYDLKQAHIHLNMRGNFETMSQGREHGSDHNCFAWPMRHGAWAVRRYGRGVAEHGSWEQDGKGWTRCFLNRDPDLNSVARIYKAVEHEKGGYVFNDFETAIKALADLKIELGVMPPWIMNRRTTIKPLRGENRVVVHIDADDARDQPDKMPGWLLEKKLWKRIFNVILPTTNESEATENYDDIIRHIVSETGSDLGWIVRRDGMWADEPLAHIRILLMSDGHDQETINNILGKAILAPWKIVNKPFQSEYPGDREWNRNAPQFAVPPTADTDNLSYPTWLKILSHCGKNLDSSIREHEWCKHNGISNGADYLKLWLSCLIKHPDQPSPYLAFWGDQDSGKSIFHEMLHLIITNGIISGDASLTNNSAFNGELQNALVCYVEETDLQKNKTAYNRIKDWVTSPRILLHVKHQTPIAMANFTHWIQTSNDQASCPVFPGDTRITMIRVSNLEKDELIGKRILMEMLRKEAPDFLASLLMLEIPEIKDRLIMPVIKTEDKIEAEARNESLLQQFIKEECFEIPGCVIKADDFVERMQIWLAKNAGQNDCAYWTKNQVGRQLDSRFPRGRLGAKDMAIHYGNISFDATASPGRRLIVKNLYLKVEDA